MTKNKNINEVEWVENLLISKGFREIKPEERNLPEFKDSLNKSRELLRNIKKTGRVYGKK